MAVKTEFHGKGIGQALINFAHEKLRKEGVNLTVTYGDINFYSKTGYELVSEDSIAAPLKLSYPDGWLAHSLDGSSDLKIKGSSSCIPELNNQSLW
jgi:predicted N-acetyltransferase YhbS